MVAARQGQHSMGSMAALAGKLPMHYMSCSFQAPVHYHATLLSSQPQLYKPGPSLLRLSDPVVQVSAGFLRGPLVNPYSC